MTDADNTLMFSILKEIRADLGQQQSLLVQFVDVTKKRFEAIDRRFDAIDRRFDAMDHRLNDLTGELEPMLKSETMGRLAHFESKVDRKIAELEERLSNTD